MQGALQCLVGVCQLGGVQFLTRRVQTEAWPILLQLMIHGVPEQSKAVYPAGDMPAAQHCVNCCLLLLLCGSHCQHSCLCYICMYG